MPDPRSLEKRIEALAEQAVEKHLESLSGRVRLVLQASKPQKRRRRRKKTGNKQSTG